MSFEEFHQLALDNYDNGGDIVAEYDKEDFQEWIDTLDCDPTTADYLYEFGKLCEFYRECEEITHKRPIRKAI